MKQLSNLRFLVLALSHLLILFIQQNSANLYSTQTCAKTQFRCHIDNSCIPLTKVQDGSIDCLDGSDEGKKILFLQKLCQIVALF